MRVSLFFKFILFLLLAAPVFAAVQVKTLQGNYALVCQPSDSNTNCSSGGTVTNVTASSPLASSGGATPNITVNSSTGSGAIVLQNSPNLTANVGVGSAAPGQALDVQGTLRGLDFKIGSNSVVVNTRNLTASSPLTGGGDLSADRSFGCQTASGSQAGCLSSSDWTTFNSKGSGTVTSIATTSPITGGTITGTGTIGINTTGPWNGVPAGAVAVAPITFNPANGNIGINTTGTWNGNAVTATSLAANGTNCSAGNYPLGVDASGNSEGCTAATTGTVTSVTLSTPNSTLSLGGTNPVTTSGTISADLNLANVNNWTANVGLNSATPGQRLDVQGTIRSTGFQLSTGASSGYELVSNSVGIGTWVAMPAAGGSGTVTSSTVNQVAYYPSSSNTVQGASNFIWNGTNVGIGSITPGKTLDVQGTARASDFNSQSNSFNFVAAITNGSQGGGQ